MRVLVITTEPVSADQLRAALPGDTDPADAEVMVVVPALAQSGLRFWLSDADEAIDRARDVGRESVDQLGDAGVAASGDTGEADIAEAIEDALRTFPADRVLVFARPDGEGRYREDVDQHELQSRFSIPITEARISSDE